MKFCWKMNFSYKGVIMYVGLSITSMLSSSSSITSSSLRSCSVPSILFAGRFPFSLLFTGGRVPLNVLHVTHKPRYTGIWQRIMMITGMRVCLPSATYTKFPAMKAGRKKNDYIYLSESLHGISLLHIVISLPWLLGGAWTPNSTFKDKCFTCLTTRRH